MLELLLLIDLPCNNMEYFKKKQIEKGVSFAEGTQIKPEWLLDIAPSGYFDVSKISEKCSARGKLDRLLTRRFSQG